MALPASGPISMSMVNTELGRTSTLLISLDTAENGGYGAINPCSPFRPSSTNPASISEWYSYNHLATCSPTPAPSATPAPVTPAPVTPAPVTPAPVTPPPTPAPVTPAPVTPAPVTPAPVTPSPTPAPVTPAPVTPAPVTPAPVTPPPTPAPVTPAPVAPTPAPTPVVNACDIIFNTSSDIYSHDPTTGTSTRLSAVGIFSPDIAITNNKLWIYSGTTIQEYNITFNPWSLSFSRGITSPFNLDSSVGLAAKSNTKLVVGGYSIIELDITTTTATQTTLFNLPSGYQVSGDIVYNPTPNTYTISYQNNSGTYKVGEFSSTGTLLNSITYNQSTYGTIYGMYSYAGALYGLTSGQVRVTINLSTGALTSPTSLGVFPLGAGQSLDCATVSFPTPAPVTPPPTPAPVTPAPVTPAPTPAPVAITYTYVSLCNTGGAISGYIVGNYTYGTNLEDTTTNQCYIAVGTTTTPTGTLMPHSFTANTCTCPTPAPTPAPVTPAPVTPAPVTPAPVTPSPTPAPVTPAPVTPAPVTPSPTPAPVTPAPVAPTCYYYEITNYNAYDTVYVNWLACGGGGSSTSFTDYDGYSHVIGTICAQYGSVSISSGNGSAGNTYTTC